MVRLSISLLGTFQVLLYGQEIAGFDSDKVRALLAYLAIESDRPHRREALAGLLWPERPERTARHNLSQALFNLRTLLDDAAGSPVGRRPLPAGVTRMTPGSPLRRRADPACSAPRGVGELRQVGRLVVGEVRGLLGEGDPAPLLVAAGVLPGPGRQPGEDPDDLGPQFGVGAQQAGGVHLGLVHRPDHHRGEFGVAAGDQLVDAAPEQHLGVVQVLEHLVGRPPAVGPRLAQRRVGGVAEQPGDHVVAIANFEDAPPPGQAVKNGAKTTAKSAAKAEAQAAAEPEAEMEAEPDVEPEEEVEAIPETEADSEDET